MYKFRPAFPTGPKAPFCGPSEQVRKPGPTLMPCPGDPTPRGLTPWEALPVSWRVSAGSHSAEIPARASGQKRSRVSWEGLAQAVLALLPWPALPAGPVGGCPQEQYVPGCQELHH